MREGEDKNAVYIVQEGLLELHRASNACVSFVGIGEMTGVVVDKHGGEAIDLILILILLLILILNISSIININTKY